MNSAAARIDPAPPAHQLAGQVWFGIRAWRLRILHGLSPANRRVARLPAGAEPEPVELARSISPLFRDPGELSPEEALWQLGKVENLRRALPGIDGVRLEPGQVFSFWKQVGPPWASRGFRVGRELRGGCIIPSVGGGLCNITNSLYDAALKAGLEIVERHAHSQVISGSRAEQGRDATVFWNYVDLRFRANQPVVINAKLERDQLVVTITAREGSAPAPSHLDAVFRSPAARLENCASCGNLECHRHIKPRRVPAEKTAVLVDAYWPEFDAWLQSGAIPLAETTLVTPMRFSRWKTASYRWRETGFSQVRDVPAIALRRSWESRRLASQGAARQAALLRQDRAMAVTLAAGADHLHSAVVLSQNLLPHLSRSGWLGGRETTVFLNRLPLRLLQARLDAAARAHPESPTLADFRCDPVLAAEEWRALENAAQLVTPHAELAALWPGKTTLLPWAWPGSEPASPPAAEAPILFPATTLGRKGAYELREAARELGLPVILGGRPTAETGSAEFWSGVDTRPATDQDWPRGPTRPRAVVLPAWIEHQPRTLLRALAEGIPVVTTEACGLHGWTGASDLPHIIPTGDTRALSEALTVSLSVPSPPAP